MNVNNIDINSLRFYNKNNKEHPPEQIKLISDSIQEFGFRQPILIDKENVVIAGHGRVLASKRLGFTEIPAVVVDDLTEEQIKAFRIMDNKSSISNWDYESLKSELEDLKQFNFDLDLTGFDEDEVRSILDEVPDEPSSFGEELQTEKASIKITFDSVDSYETLSPVIRKELEKYENIVVSIVKE